MMHKAWSNIEEVTYCFWRSSIKFQGYTGQKITYFDPNWEFPDCNSSLNSPMALKWCTQLDVVQKRCCSVLQGHLSNFKVTQDKKITNLDPSWVFLECNSSLNLLIDLNDAQSLTYYRRSALLYFKVIHHISRSHGLKNQQFESNMSKITKPIAATKSLRFALFLLVLHF